MNAFSLLEQLSAEHTLDASQWEALIAANSPELAARAAEMACAVRHEIYGNRVFIRGLIEFTSYCRNDCYYCGLRRSNRNAQRYRLTEEQSLSCCEVGWELGFRPCVLQGGEDPWFTDEKICALVREIKR